MSIKKTCEVWMKSQIILTINTNILTIIFCYSVDRQTFWLSVRLLLKMSFISVFYLLNVLIVITSLNYSSSQPITDSNLNQRYKSIVFLYSFLLYKFLFLWNSSAFLQGITDKRNGIQYAINVLSQIDENLSNLE